MSLERDSAEIQRLLEDVFKSADDKELSKRRWNAEAAWRKKFISLSDGTQVNPTTDNAQKVHDDALENHPEVWEEVWEEEDPEVGTMGDFAENIYDALEDIYKLDNDYPICQALLNIIYDNMSIDQFSGKLIYVGLE